MKWIMENSDVSSANSGYGINFFKLKKRDPKIDPCVTPALTGNHSDIWSFKRTI